MKRLLLLVLAASVLAGCASGRCRGDTEYQQATSLPAAPVEGLQSATSAGAMAVPPAPAQIVPYGRTVQVSGAAKPTLECLDMPPAKS